MRVLILAFAFTFTAFPVSGQVRQKILQRAERSNISVQNRIGYMYDMGRVVPEIDTKNGSWKRVLMGAGIGLTVGFAVGWTKDFPDDGLFGWGGSDMHCVTPAHGSGPCLRRDNTARHRITWSLGGIGAGAALGWLWPFGEDDPE